jgi:hypothetical protein
MKTEQKPSKIRPKASERHQITDYESLANPKQNKLKESQVQTLHKKSAENPEEMSFQPQTIKDYALKKWEEKTRILAEKQKLSERERENLKD